MKPLPTLRAKSRPRESWAGIGEARSLNGINFHDLSDAEFDRIPGLLEESGIQVYCVGSTIANWGRPIDGPFEPCLEAARRAVPRMRRLGTRLIRVMSYAVVPDRGPDDQMENERFRRWRILQQVFTDAGITMAHTDGG